MRTSYLACLALCIGCEANPNFVPNPDLARPGFAVGGVVDGLRGTLIVSNSGGDLLQLSMSGPFTFFDRIEDGAAYDVAVYEQPDGQNCTVEGGQGTIAGADITSVVITCADSDHAIGGVVSGLEGTLVLQNNGGDDLTLTMSGDFVFDSLVPHGDPYDVTVAAQPDGQECTVSNGAGLAESDITDVTIDCVPTFTIGGTISGLTGTVVLQNNGGDDLAITGDSEFSFEGRIADGEAYDVSISEQPDGQRCTVSDGTGEVGGGDVTSVTIVCENVHTIGGTITGLQGGLLVLRNNGGDDLPVTFPNDSFTFNEAVVEGGDYLVSVAVQPTGQICTVSAGGTVSTSDVTDVAVICRKLAVLLDEVYARPATGAYGDTNHDGVRDGTDDEFVELLNHEAFPVNIGGWVIRTAAANPKITFPPGTTLAPGERALIFGGGTPTGSFGGAQVFLASGLSLTDGGTEVLLQSLATNGVTVDNYLYDGTAFGTSCTTKCESRNRSGTDFVPHTTLSQSPGVLWSPGVAPTQAIPKLATAFSTPTSGATNVSVLTNLVAQFNMFMNAAQFTPANVKLFASSCAAPANEVTLSSVTQGSDASQVSLSVGGAPLAFSTTYCMTTDGAMESAAPTPSPSPVTLGATASIEFTTRAAASTPSGTVVISEYGGTNFSTNDEFVELYNPTNAPVDLSGWYIARRTPGGTASCWAVLPAASTIAPQGFFLVGGAGYGNPSPAPDFDTDTITFPSPSPAPGTVLLGNSESVVLKSAGVGVTCTNSAAVVDTVSAGTSNFTDSLAGLQLPAFGQVVGNGHSIERKACWNSTADGDGGTGLFGGGHSTNGNAERSGSSASDLLLRPTPEPQNSSTPPENGMCSS